MNKKLKEIREWGFFILALGTLMIGIFSFVFYAKTNPPTNPEIDIDLFDQTVFNVNTLASISYYNEGNFLEHKSILRFQITNLGLKDTGSITIDMKDPEKEYKFIAYHLEDLESLDDQFFPISFVNKDCQNAVNEAKWNNESWKIASNECKIVRESLITGKRDLLLRIGCPGCEFDNGEYQCYSLEVCIYRTGNEICGEDPDYYELKETNCPKDWYP